MASASNHREIISGDQPACNHLASQIDNDEQAGGTPASSGRSQAIPFTSTLTLGKAGWLPGAQRLVEAREALIGEPVAPLADNLPPGYPNVPR